MTPLMVRAFIWYFEESIIFKKFLKILAQSQTQTRAIELLKKVCEQQ